MKLELTPQALIALRAFKDPTKELLDESEPLPNGNRLVPFDQETVQRLAEHMYPGESYSDTILRLCAAARGSKH